MPTPLMIMGCPSDAGKSCLGTAFCRHLANRGVRVAPFKTQNMRNNVASHVVWRNTCGGASTPAVWAKQPACNLRWGRNALDCRAYMSDTVPHDRA